MALLILSLGLMGSARLHAGLQLDSDIARQRSAAVRLAQLDLEGQRAFARVSAAPEKNAYATLVSVTTAVESANTLYTVERRVTDDNTATLKFSTVDVHWPDRNGTVQHVLLHSSISGSMPATSGALALAPAMTAIGQPQGRHPGIPPLARNLGDGRSIWQMAGSPRTGYIFDNTSGEVRARCALAPVSASAAGSHEATPADLLSCESFRALLLQGVVRFALGPRPEAVQANDPALPFVPQLQLDPPGNTDPPCELQPPQTQTNAPSPRTGTGAGPMPPTQAGGPPPADPSETAAAYTCLVALSAGKGWSGVFTVTARGWTIGTAPSQYRICRYSADLDQSGRIDRNEEHPGRYHDVTGNLVQQNYLVIRGELSCPRSPLAPHNDASADTVQHQP